MKILHIGQQNFWKWSAQLIVVLLCAAALKLHYSAASVNDLRWILEPTAFLSELITGAGFTFESYAGYMSGDHTFLIAASCSGVNFLIAAFLMLSLGRLWRDRSQVIKWRFIPAAMLVAYTTAIIANTVRISAALRMRELDPDLIWLNPDQLHRFEGIFIYFGFLLLLFILNERTEQRSTNASSLFRRSLFPLLIYYATALGIPLANGAFGQGAAFWEHSAFVLVTPWLLILPLAAFRFIKAAIGTNSAATINQRWA